MAMHKGKLLLTQKLKAYVALSICRGIRTTHKCHQNEITADVVIAGGGMVGTSLSCALGSSKRFHNRKIILLEAGKEGIPKNWETAPFENRVSSITPGSHAFLNDIGVWEKIVARRHNAYQDLRVWDAVGSGCIDLNCNDINERNMAYMVENSVIIESCMERAKELSSNVEMQFDALIDDVRLPYNEDGSSLDPVEVKMGNGDVIRTKLLVGADGPNSFIRDRANIRTYDYNYNQSAVVATLNIKNETLTNKTAWQRFLSTGPIALLPLSADVSSLVWSTTKEKAKELVQDDEETFIMKVNEAVSGHQGSENQIVGGVNHLISNLISAIEPGRLAANYAKNPPIVTSVQPKSRGMFPLMLKHSPLYVKKRLALVGDAAHRIHPMAGLGVNLGFGDVKKLTECMDTAVYEGEDYGTLEVLFPYETDRQKHVASVIAAINSLHNLFSTTVTPVVLARTLGLHATNSISPIKKEIIRYAMQ